MEGSSVKYTIYSHKYVCNVIIILSISSVTQDSAWLSMCVCYVSEYSQAKKPKVFTWPQDGTVCSVHSCQHVWGGLKAQEKRLGYRPSPPLMPTSRPPGAAVVWLRRSDHLNGSFRTVHVICFLYYVLARRSVPQLDVSYTTLSVRQCLVRITVV